MNVSLKQVNCIDAARSSVRFAKRENSQSTSECDKRCCSQSRLPSKRHSRSYGRSNTFLVVENILHFQNPDGGWGKRGDYTINYSKKQLKKVYQAPDSLDSNGENVRVSSDFDNECTWGHIHYLDQAYRMLATDNCIRESIEKEETPKKSLSEANTSKEQPWENKKVDTSRITTE